MAKKRETPGEGFPLALRAIHPSCAIGRKRNVSLSAESDQRRRLWKPPPFEKGGPKLYYLVWNLIIGKTGEHSSPLRLDF